MKIGIDIRSCAQYTTPPLYFTLSILLPFAMDWHYSDF